MLDVTRFIFNNFEENTYLAVDRASRQAVLIDPGMLNERERATIDNFISSNGITLKYVVLTHVHLDHIFGVEHVRQHYGVPVLAHKDDSFLAQQASSQCFRFGMAGVITSPVIIDLNINQDTKISLGDSCLEVIEVPGHSPGGIVLYDKTDGVAFVGDSIFQGSIGRTDLPGGDYNSLINNLKTKIITLPDSTILLPGHGDSTTVGQEKAHNPYLKN